MAERNLPSPRRPRRPPRLAGVLSIVFFDPEAFARAYLEALELEATARIFRGVEHHVRQPQTNGLAQARSTRQNRRRRSYCTPTSPASSLARPCFIASPGLIANYIERIPRGETRSIARLRNELARRNRAQATCPVTTAIYLRVVAEVALTDLGAGKPIDRVIPFWRVVEPGSKIAAKLSCDAAYLDHLIALDVAPQEQPG